MHPNSYEFSISRMDHADDLHATRRDIADDADLDADEKKSLRRAIDVRFGFLNRYATPPVGRYAVEL